VVLELVKIKVSYETDQELKEVRLLLTPFIAKLKQSSNKEGKYKKAYIDLKEIK
jgi:hypothetical protein